MTQISKRKNSEEKFLETKKYLQNSGQIHLFIIYPKQEDFITPLQFQYEEELKIDVIPFDFESEQESLLPLFQSSLPIPPLLAPILNKWI